MTALSRWRTTKSSPYLMTWGFQRTWTRSPAWPQLVLAGNWARRCASRPCKAMLANNGETTPPTILQTFFFRAGIARTGIDPEHDVDLVMRDFHPLHQRTDHLPFPTPIGLCQPLLDLRRKVLQAPNDQGQFGVQGGLLSELLVLRFQVGDPLAEPDEPRLKRLLFNEPIDITIDQP